MLALPFVASCAFSPPTYTIRTPFDPRDFAPYASPGPASVMGQAFLTTVAGDVKTCAGANVYLVPANPYGKEMELSDRTRARIINMDPHVAGYMRKTACDAEGRFSFVNVPALPWYVQTVVSWGVPDDDGDIDEQGGILEMEILPAPGWNAVLLTDRDLL